METYQGEERRVERAGTHRHADKVASNPYIRLGLPVLTAALVSVFAWLILDAIQSRDNLRELNTTKIEAAFEAVSNVQVAVGEIQTAVEGVVFEVHRARDGQSRVWQRLGNIGTRVTVLEALQRVKESN